MQIKFCLGDYDMKKILLCMLIAVFSLSSLNVWAYEENMPETIRSVETEFLEAYGFTETAEAKISGSISRGEFSYLAAKLLNIGIDGAVAVVPFSDVNVDDKCYIAVSQLSSAGIITGVGDSYFKPDEPINVEHACKILVKVLGYTHFVKDNNYMSAAILLKLLAGVNVYENGEISEYSAFMMIYNALNSDASMSNYVDGFSYKKEENVFFSERFGIYKTVGVLTDNGITSLTSKSSVKSDEVVVKNTVFKANEDMSGLLGHKLIVWYTVENEGENVIGFYEDVSKDSVITFDASDIDDYDVSLNTYCVFENNRLKKVAVEKDFSIIYNNIAYTNPNASNIEVLKNVMLPKSGSVTLINTNGKGYDLVIIKSYKNYMVTSIDSQSMTLYDSNRVHSEVSFKDTKVLDVKTSDGRKMSFKDIPSSSVVSIAQSEDNIYAELIVSTEILTGNIETWSDDEMELGTEILEFTPEYKQLVDANNSGITKFSPVNAYVTFDHKVLYCEVGSSDNIEFVYICKIGQPKGISNSFSIMVYTEINELKAVPLASKVRIDGQLYTNTRKMYEYLSQSKYSTDNIAAVRLNSNGELVYIDLAHNPYTDGTCDLKYNDFRIAGNIWRSEAAGFKNKYLGGSCATGPDTMAFVVAKNGEWEDIWAVPVSKISNIFTEVMSAYTFNPDSLIADAVILYRNAPVNDITVSSIASINPMYIVSDVATEINTSGNECVKLTVTTNGSEFLDFYTETTDGAKCFKSGRSVAVGDVVMFGLSKNNRIPDGNLVIMFRAETGDMFYNSAYYDIRKLTYRSSGLVAGWLNRMTETHFELSNVDPRNYESDLDIPVAEKTIFVNNMPCIVYDRTARNDKITIGGVSDFSPYNGGNNPQCPKVLIHVTGDTTKFIYVVK